MPECRWIMGGAVLLMLFTGTGWAADPERHGFPRLMGMNIARPVDYDKEWYQDGLSRMDIVIIGFWAGWGRSKPGVSEVDVVRRIKQRNSDLMVGQYTILNECRDVGEKGHSNSDIAAKIEKENWWLRTARGERVRWTDQYGAWDVNISPWTKPDEDGLRFPQWLARRNFRVFFEPVAEFDIWYLDQFLSRPPVAFADWDGDGRNDRNSDSHIAAAYRQGNLLYWNEARKLFPQGIFMGNSDDISSPEYSGQLQGVFLEALIGKSWSTESREGWEAAMRRYRSAMAHTAPPHIVGFNVWGAKTDYRRMRYGLVSCLLDNGYFSYTDQKSGYASVVWFDEYDIELGRPVDPPPTSPWDKGIYRRRFENGMVLLNPGWIQRSISLAPGYRRFRGRQAPDINDGAPVDGITIAARDGILLIK